MTVEVDQIYRIPPLLTDLNREFWIGGEVGELRIWRCRTCDEWLHPPSPVCRKCHSTDVGFDVASGRATVSTFSINHYQWSAQAGRDPYVIAIVELEEDPGLRLITNIVGCGVGEVRIGQRVQVIFRSFDDVWLPLFEPASNETDGTHDVQ